MMLSSQPAIARWCTVTVLLLLGIGPLQAEPAFLGNESCTGCHTTEAADWNGSHHDLAMQVARAGTVLGDFDNARFSYAGVTTLFYRRDTEFWVRTDGPKGTLEDFRVTYVFGVYPLQQLLLPLPGGRLQALSIAWDARPADQGGQRWYHLYPEDNIRAGDPLHWTGPYQNWNTRCAECHSTNVKKGYDRDAGVFNTTWDQIDVGCEACHGPGERHTSLVAAGAVKTEPFGGFEMSLADSGDWSWPEGAAIARRTDGGQASAQIDNCGRCHARRSTLGDYHYGAELLDTHNLALVESPLYWPDGQIRDEVYVYGSFIQSRMHQAGVVCSDCHNPHSATLLAEGNALCGRCHQPQVYNSEEHHRHRPGSTGSLCVDCHMPESTYMGVDPRRDHSLRVPRPDLSIAIGSPNACTQCHDDKSASWALKALRDWGVTDEHPARQSATAHPGSVFHRAERGDVRTLPNLGRIIADESLTAMTRGSAALHYGHLGPPDLAETAAPLLGADEALLRVAGVRAASALPPTQRFLLLRPLITDPVLSVRMAVAEQLAGAPQMGLRPKDLAALKPLYAEYLATYEKHSDMPSALTRVADFQRQQGSVVEAENTLREALRINPQLEAARVNLADLLRSTDRDDDARTLLLDGIAQTPDAGALHHALGLLEIRAGQLEVAMKHLQRAADLETTGSRHRFVYAVALHDTGAAREAIVRLERLNTLLPGNPEVLYTLMGWSREAGDPATFNRYRDQLDALTRTAGLR